MLLLVLLMPSLLLLFLFPLLLSGLGLGSVVGFSFGPLVAGFGFAFGCLLFTVCSCCLTKARDPLWPAAIVPSG